MLGNYHGLVYASVSAIKLMEPNLTNKHTVGKGISRGTEWYKFQLRSTIQSGVMGA